jgi:hypothetical protein
MKQVGEHTPAAQPPEAQVVGVAAGQLPAPSQKLAGASVVSFVQLAAAHWVLLPGYVQAVRLPAPHVPAQAPEPAQAAREPWGGPDVTALQVPAEPDTSHASHAPPHAPLQHTPSTHNVLWHCEFVLHALLLGRAAVQPPLTQ